MGHVSDVSDVEFNPRPNKKMLKLNFNLDTLHDSLAKINDAILVHGGLINDIQSTLKLKASDRAIGVAFERMSISVSRELGERPAKFQLDDPNFLADEQGTPDAKFLKVSVD